MSHTKHDNNLVEMHVFIHPSMSNSLTCASRILSCQRGAVFPFFFCFFSSGALPAETVLVLVLGPLSSVSNLVCTAARMLGVAGTCSTAAFCPETEEFVRNSGSSVDCGGCVVCPGLPDGVGCLASGASACGMWDCPGGKEPCFFCWMLNGRFTCVTMLESVFFCSAVGVRTCWYWGVWATEEGADMCRKGTVFGVCVCITV